MSAGLSSVQAASLERWLPGWTAVADHSWGLIGTTVLEVVADSSRYIVKAGDEADIHIARELRAHREFLTPFVAGVEVSLLIHADSAAKILVFGFLSGDLAEGTRAASEKWLYTEAGRFLARLHGQFAVADPDYPARQIARAERWLREPWSDERLKRPAAGALLELADAIPSMVAPNHGDFSPRNWLVDGDALRVIDFGRAELRPPATDLHRLSTRSFLSNRALEEAFFDGYGADPREEQAWAAVRLCEAIGTIGWAHQVRDTAFEREGVRELGHVLTRL